MNGRGRPGRGARDGSRPAYGPSRAPARAGEQVEGLHAVRQLLVARRRRAHLLWADERLATKGTVSELVALARGEGVRVELRSAKDLRARAATDAPQGVIAWAEPLPAVALEQLLVPATGGDLLVVLDGVSDPGNLGSVLRSAACAGASGVVAGSHRSASLTPGAMKAAAGAAEVVPVAWVAGIPAALATIRAAGWWAVGLDPRARDDIWGEALLGPPVALVLGSEGKGISRLARERCDGLAAVPMSKLALSAGIGSLNVASACAVACFEVARRRARAGGVPERAPARDDARE